MNKPVTDITHEEKLELLRELKENAENGTEKLQDLLAWFIAATRKR